MVSLKNLNSQVCFSVLPIIVPVVSGEVSLLKERLLDFDRFLMIVFLNFFCEFHFLP